MSDPYEQVRVGVGVMLQRDGKVLLGMRKGAHGADRWSFPGGHLEKGETIEQCARREVREETGLEIVDVKYLFTARSSAFLPRDYLHIGMTALAPYGEPVRCEPDKCGGWSWHAHDALPQPMFLFAALSFDAQETRQVFYDAKDIEGALRRAGIRI